METGLIFNIQRYSVQDGPGIRTTVFLKGCPLDCWWCHNPESQSPDPALLAMEDRCIRCGQCQQACPKPADGVCKRCGACAEACPTGAKQMVGQTMTVADVLAAIRRDHIFYDQSGGGVTFSGGEPLMQFAFLYHLLEACRNAQVHTALDTSGFAPQGQLLAAAALSDLVLFDLKLIDDQKHRQYTGVSNALILENARMLGQSHENIWIRIPIIPEVNDAPADLEAAARFVRSIPGVRKVSLLPYHQTAEAKLERLGRPNRLAGVTPPSSERINAIARYFKQLGVDAKIGG